MATNQSIRHPEQRRGIRPWKGGRRRFSPEEELQLTEDLRTSKSARATGRKWDCCHKLVRTIAERNDYTPPIFVPHTVNEFSFDVLTSDAEYAIGLLITDGNINDTRPDRQNTVYLSLSNEGMVQVEWLKQFLNATHSVYYYDGTTKSGEPTRRAVLSIQSTHIADALFSYGVTPRKTTTARFEKGVENSRHAWRGVVDGDGCILVSKTGYPTVQFVGSVFLMEQAKAYVEKQVGSSRGKVMSTDDDCYRYSVHGDHACSLIRLLYGNCTAAMPAKQEKAWRAVREWQGEIGLDLRLMPDSVAEGEPPNLIRRDQAWKRRVNYPESNPNIAIEELESMYDVEGCWRKVASRLLMTYESMRYLVRALRTKKRRGSKQFKG